MRKSDLDVELSNDEGSDIRQDRGWFLDLSLGDWNRQDQRPTSILDPVGVVERTIDIGVHVVHFLDNLP